MKTERYMGQAGLLVPTVHFGRTWEHEPLLTGTQDTDSEEERGGHCVSAPSLFSFAFRQRALNPFLHLFSSLLPISSSRALAPGGCAYSSTILPHLPMVQLRDETQHRFAEDTS